MDRDWRGIVLAEIVIIWVLYMQRHSRLSKLKGAIDGALTLNTQPISGSSK